MAFDRKSVERVLGILGELGIEALPGAPIVRWFENIDRLGVDPRDCLLEFLLRQGLAESPILHVLSNHRDWVTSAVYAPDDTVLTASNDHSVRFWDSESGRELHRLDLGASPRFYSGRPQLSADGTRVLIPTVDGRVHVGEWKGQDHLTVLSAGRDITRAALSRDGDVVVAGLKDNTALLWLDVTAAPIVLGEPADDDLLFVSAVAISAGGRHAAVGSSNGLLRIWRVGAHPGPPIVLPGATDYLNSVLFGMNDELVAAASDDRRGYLWRWRDSSTPTVLEGNKGEANHIELSRNGRRAVTAGVDKTARVWTDSGIPVAVLGGFHDELLDVTFSPDNEGALVAAASADGTAAIFDVNAGRRLLTLRSHSGTAFTARFNGDGSKVVTSCADTKARIWRVSSGTTFRGHEDRANSAALDPDGKTMVSASDDTTVRHWDLASGRQLKVLRVHTGPVNEAAWSPDGHLVATAGIDGISYLWKPRSTSPPIAISVVDLGPGPSSAAADPAQAAAAVPSTQAFDYGIISVSFSADGQRLLLATRRELLIYRVGDQHLLHRFRLVKPGSDPNPFEVATGATFSPDSQFILTAQLDKTARLRRAADGNVVRELGEDEQNSYPDAVYSAAFNDLGTRVVVANGDGALRIFTTANGQLVIRLVGQWGQLRSAAFSHGNGGLVAAGDTTGRLHVWRETGQLVMVSRAHAERINSLEFSRDNKWLLSASDDRMVRWHPVEQLPSLPKLVAAAGERVYGAAANTVHPTGGA
jgi:WD40 repeat protein